jgi:hypothetical protein
VGDKLVDENRDRKFFEGLRGMNEAIANRHSSLSDVADKVSKV